MEGGRCSPVAKRVDEVEAAMDSVVLDVPPVETRLISEVLVILLITVVNYRLPAKVRQKCIFHEQRNSQHTNTHILNTSMNIGN